ncbi:MAG: CO dehydrogenase/acetyl-CoA synthase complex subunit epsilon [Candidatus Bathyarchaeia archaeon]
MSAKLTTGQTAEIPGPKKAFLVPKPEVAASMINRARRPLLVVGSDAMKVKTKDGDLVDTAIRMSRSKNITVAATGHLAGEFRRRGAVGVHGISIMELGDRLRDSGWSGLDVGGPYDLVVFVGLPYYLEWLILSGLKNSAPSLRTLSLDNTYHPNAHWSLGYSPHEEWIEILDRIVANLEEVG